MRIVGGRWGGRHIRAPEGSRTRPTSDRVREAIFDILTSRCRDALSGGAVLDAFGGCGALAFEALSRGVHSATIVDNDQKALVAARANAGSLGTDSTTIVAADVLALARHGLVDGGPFALLFVDPPYRIEQARVRGLLEDLVTAGSLVDGAVVVHEHDSSEPVAWPEGFEAVTERVYGDTGVSIAVFTRGD